MISKEEFLALYEKYMSGQCTDAEIRLLETYRDEMQLADEGWEDKEINEADVRARIWRGLNEKRRVIPINKYKTYKNRWLQVAAVLLVALMVGSLFILIKKKQGTNNEKLTDAIHQKPIVPGANRAYLTLANGTKIVLDDAKNGALTSQSGVKVSKTGDGVVVYKFIKSIGGTAENKLPEFNTISTPRGGKYQVILADGTHVWLNAASSIRFPQAFNGPQRLVELSGEAYFEVAKDKGRPFIVQANGTKVQVFGTHFNVNAYPDNNNVTTTLLEGSVQMSNNSQATMLVPGERGVSTTSGGAISVSRADIQQAIAWKNGYFMFHDLSIVEVMKQVSRWYDVDIEYKDEDVKNKEFGGIISRYKSITELLDNMQLTGSAHYKIEGRRVIIMK